jgi:two-component system, NarL family, response regulator LiaR
MVESINTAQKKPRLLIAEDHDLVREGLSYTLERKGAFEIVIEAKNGEEAVQLVLTEQMDIVLMDIEMPIMDGILATQQIKEKSPNTKVIILTSHRDGNQVYASLAAGADAYCLKDIKMERLIQVIEMVYEGAVWLDPTIARMVMDILPLNMPDVNKPLSTRQRYNTELTERELQVLQQIVEGKTNKEIAKELSITIHTVKVHVCNVIQKLAVDDRTQAAVKALRDGLIQKVVIQ